ncbi:MAG TPA: nicotinamide-nucleotide amidohydrolase family protein [Jiangellaceae bacterium]|nr:nicotinamide-nucleotide amidohydrolase family protein [Jiangellaceae bacterium]
MIAAGAGTVALVLVGDELLAGHVADANGPWLGRALADAGLQVVSAAYARDDLAAVVTAVERGLDDARAVIVTGGLGETNDDVTRPALARIAGDVSGVDLPNGQGIEPGVRLDLGRGTVYAVPGVPREMAAMVSGQVMPHLTATSGELLPRVTRSLTVVGVREARVAAALEGLEDTLGADGGLAFLPRPGEVEVRIRVAGPDADAVAAEAVVRARELLGDIVAAVDRGLEEAVVDDLARLGATVATAESLTGGLLCGALVSVPGSSTVVRGGVVAYATDLKERLAGVPGDVLDRRGPVAAETAAAMAHGIRNRCAATFGVATTGVAGPDPQDGRPAGTFHVAVASATDVRVGGLRPSPRWPAGRELVRRLAVVHALDLLRRFAGGIAGGVGESTAAPTR